MAQLASLAFPVRPPRDAAAEDHIGYDAWLLPPEEIGPSERVLRFCSIIAGPIAFAISLGFTLRWIA